MKSYFRQTSTLTYSYLACLPLFVVYEVLIRISQPDATAVVRLSADIWIQNLLLLFHENTLLLSFIVIAVLGGFIFYRERKKTFVFRPGYFVGMVGESTVWAVVLAVFVSGVTGLLFALSAVEIPANASLLLAEGSAGITRLQMLALSIGAGLYEELVFRVVLVYLLIYAFGYFLEQKHAMILAVVIAAALFSAVHYTGSLGDPFTLSSFVFRMLFGLALNALLVVRGFGITAWTHSMYDVILVVFFWPG
ncbi:MAG: CPBP family intramembrane metalloprotease [Balneolia bacterium]|nr:CPBP family intramembrane metalloprotease [Balneolia bacterium]